MFGFLDTQINHQNCSMLHASTLSLSSRLSHNRAKSIFKPLPPLFTLQAFPTTLQPEYGSLSRYLCSRAFVWRICHRHFAGSLIPPSPSFPIICPFDFQLGWTRLDVTASAATAARGRSTTIWHLPSRWQRVPQCFASAFLLVSPSTHSRDPDGTHASHRNGQRVQVHGDNAGVVRWLRPRPYIQPSPHSLLSASRLLRLCRIPHKLMASERRDGIELHRSKCVGLGTNMCRTLSSEIRYKIT